MMDAISSRDLLLDDIEQLADLAGRATGDRKPAEYYAWKYFGNPQGRVRGRCAVDGDRLVGSAGWIPQPLQVGNDKSLGAQAVDAMLIVVEPGRRSIEVAERISELAGDLKLKHLYAVGNKVRTDFDRAFIADNSPVPVIGYLSASAEVIEADLKGLAVYKAAPATVAEAQTIVNTLEAEAGT